MDQDPIIETAPSGGEIADAAARLSLFMSMPLSFNMLLIEMTARCNARCTMCYQSAGPKGSDEIGDVRLAVDDLIPVLREAATLGCVQPHFHLTGGEPFLHENDCYRLFVEAKQSGFVEITSTTNAYWARKADRAESVCRRMVDCGVTGLEVSWDVWHMPFVPAEAVANCLYVAHRYGIDVNLRLLTTRSHSIEEALKPLPDEALGKARLISTGPAFPIGRAARRLDRRDLFARGTLDDNCHSFLNLTVNARGDVAPCCAGIDQTDTLGLGNIRNEGIGAIVERMNRSSLVRSIVFKGVGSLLPALRRAGHTEAPEGYTSICHLCWSIFSDPVRAAVVKSYFDDFDQAHLLGAVSEDRAGQKAPV